jgi:hypothetical protein
MATDLRNAIAAPFAPTANWVKESNGRRYVKALIVARTSDPEMTSLRAAVLARGGSVVHALRVGHGPVSDAAG